MSSFSVEPSSKYSSCEARAFAAWAKRCQMEGYGYQQPSTPANVVRLTKHGDGKGDWERFYIVLTNTNGILACYRIQEMKDGTERLKWIDRIPSEICKTFG